MLTQKRVSMAGKALVLLFCVCTLVFTFYQGREHPRAVVSVPPREDIIEPPKREKMISVAFKRADATPPTLSNITEKPKDPRVPWIERVSWEPRVFVYHNLLMPEECDQIIAHAGTDVSRSLVVATKGGSAESEWRTSKGVFLTRQYMEKSPLLRTVEKRIAEWTQIPVENGEAFYLLRYEKGQQYRPHHDFFSNDESGKQFIGTSGNRFATVLTYLKTPDDGGETHFPEKMFMSRLKLAILFCFLICTQQMNLILTLCMQGYLC